MKAGTTTAFLLLFILVGVCYLYLDPVHNPPLNAPVLSQDVFHSADGEITMIQIQNLERNETLKLVNENGQWKITYPIQYPADPMMAQGLNAALKFSHKARRLVPEKGWDEYGLLRPAIKIGVENKPGQRRYLYLGDKSPVGPFVYARWEGEKDYFLVSQDLKAAFDRSLYGLRLKKVFRLPLKDVTGLYLHRGAATYEIKKQKTGEWVWSEPVSALNKKVSEQSVVEILNRLQDLNAKEFLDNEKTVKDFEGDTIVLRLHAGDQSEKIKVGGEMELQDAFRAMRSDESVPLLISRPNLNSVFQAWDEAYKKAAAA